jgi:hypothetical protein
MITENKTNHGLTYEDVLRIAEAFNFTSSVSLKSGNKIKFTKWNLARPTSINNIILLSKSEANKHFEARNETDLLNLYGEEVYNRICTVLKKIKE